MSASGANEFVAQERREWAALFGLMFPAVCLLVIGGVALDHDYKPGSSAGNKSWFGLLLTIPFDLVPAAC